MVDINGIDNGMTVALGYHQGNDTATRAHIKHAMSACHGAPGSQQHAIGTHLHRRAVIDHGKLLESEYFFSSHNRTAKVNIFSQFTLQQKLSSASVKAFNATEWHDFCYMPVD